MEPETPAAPATQVEPETQAEPATSAEPEAPAEADAPGGATADAGEAADDSARALGDERGVAVIPVAPRTTSAPRKKRTLRVARPAPAEAPRVLAIDGLVKRYGDTTAVDAISLDVRAGSFYGIVGPNGAGKTTTLSMVTGLLRPDAGAVRINDIDVWKDPRAAKRATGVLPDRLRLFDRLTGSELLYYSGSLRGLDHQTVLDRSADLAAAFGLEDALDRLVADYSAGMTKKIALACAMIHSPRLLVLDEPFESVDPVSAANLTDILERYVAGGGTVLLSSHSMDLIERVCDSAAIIVGGRVLASGTLDEVRQGQTLEDRFVELAGGRKAAEGLEWLHSFSD
ncbi:MAG TPA: ATP-binding cassette domain-containing protein [Agromyces sp.]